MTPSTVLAVWEEGGEGCELWSDIVWEMRIAFATDRAFFAHYDECFEKIGVFRRAVGEAICD